jgi:hypothetical protein
MMKNGSIFQAASFGTRAFTGLFASGFMLLLLAGITPAAIAQAAPQSRTVVEQKVTPGDGATNSFFGSAAALDDSTALIGADGDASFRGSAYLFNKSAGTWTEGQKLVPSDGLGGDEFGYRVALGHATLVVGAFSATVNGVASQGAAYVFTKSGETWSESQKLLASDGALFDDFGASVALDGNTIVVGANGATVGQNPAQGAVYVFTRSNGVWTQTQKLTADDGGAYDNFGLSVALQGSTILVGSPVHSVEGNFGQGTVYVYRFSNGVWSQTQKLTADDGAAGDGFGESVAIHRSNALVGAYNAGAGGHPGAGAVYVFTNSGDTLGQVQKLTASDPADFANFGNAVALHGRTALIGADVSPVGNNTSQGKAYIFAEAAGNWTEADTLIASDGVTDDFFGAALALDAGTALVSTPHPTINGNSYQGAAYFYRRVDNGGR